MDPITGTAVAGMVISATLQVLFDRVASRVVLDFFRAKKLDDGLLRKLKITLLAIDKLLDDAEEKQITDKRVKKWLEELQDAVYDAEDLLDAVNTEAMQRKLEKESRPKSAKSKLKLKLHDILKPSTHSYGEMETKLKENLQRLEDILKQKNVLGLREGVGVAEKPPKKLPTTSLVEEHDVYGRDDDKESIVKLLLAETSANDSLGVITIKGMGGIGKTTLAQLVYNDTSVVKHFDFRAWVCISEEFEVFKVTRTILEAVTSSTSVSNNPDLLQVELKKNLVDKKFLLVMDDVWNDDRSQWEMLKKPLQHGAKGSKILVTTRNEGVAKIMRTVPTYYLEKLSEKDTWTLFAQYAFEGGECQAHPSFREVGREIVKKCEGLPLAAKALGGLLRYKTTTEEWDKIMESNVWDLKDADCNILPVLRVSYHHLPSHLKRCFAFCSVFPKDYEFEKNRLILLWAAQSLLLDPEAGENMQSTGEEYFGELISRSFFERSSANKSLFVMHDLMHDLAASVSGQYCGCMDRDGTQEISHVTRHMSYFRMSLRQFETLPMKNCLRTLIQLEKGEKSDGFRSVYLYHEEVPDGLLTRFKLLRVLSLPEYEIYELPESIGSLKHLRYFDLSKTTIKRLPDSMCNLFNLQTLILSDCWNLTELPANIWKLVNLLYLDITRCYKLKEMPGNIGGLKNLARLSTFVVGNDSHGASIRELGPLVNLHEELSILELQNVVSPADVTDARLKDKKYLEKLKLSWRSDQDGPRQEYEVLEKLQPHKSLKELTIESYGDARFPNWIGNQLYSNMVSLNLENCNYCNSIPMLGQLPSLKKLFISGFDELQKVDPQFYGNRPAIKPFGSLEILSFQRMAQWEEWLHCDGEALPLLQELRIENCPKLRRNFPSHLPSLTKLTVENCPELATSLPNAPALSYLRLVCSNEMLLNDVPQGLESLHIHQYEGLQSLPERLTQTRLCLQHLNLFRCPSLTSLPQVIFSSTLKSVEMYGCHNLLLPIDQEFTSLESLTIEYSCNSLRSFPLQCFPKLTHLEISGCDNIESFSLADGTSQEFQSLIRLDICGCPKFLGFPDGGLPFPDLRYFSFQNNVKATSLPKKMQSLQFLQSFILHNCPSIESLPEGGLPSSLTLLWISCCDEIAAQLIDWGLYGLNSLRDLQIQGQCHGVVSFPSEGLLPETLTVLKITGFSDLEILEHKGLQNLKSLSELTVWACPKLHFLPPEGLPTSLTSLHIGECPLMKQRLKREQGEDWDKIARIPHILVDGKVVLS